MVHEATAMKRVAAKAEPTTHIGRTTVPRSDSAPQEGTSNAAPWETCSGSPVQQAYITDCPEEDRPTIATTNPNFGTYNMLHSPKDVEEGWEDMEDLPRGVYHVRPDQDFRNGSVLSGPDIVVADEAYKLHTIFAWVNKSDQPTECILDPGSQIVAISGKKVHELNVAWDPKSSSQLLCVNGTCDTTLGVVRNILLKIGDWIVVYMQMHVVRHAAYNVLLGRPFDVLMSCTVVNSPDWRQTITVHCPDSKHVLTIPTYVRGESPSLSCSYPQGFVSLMI